MSTHSVGRRDICLHTVCFLTGILVVQRLPSLPSLWWATVGIPMLVVILRRRRWASALFFIAGFAWFTLRAGLILDQRLPTSLESQDIIAEGRVCSLPQERESYLKFDFAVERLRAGSRVSVTPRRVRLRIYDIGLEPRAGERWRLRVRLKRPHGLQNPGGFDYEKSLFRAGISAVGYVRPDPLNQQLGNTLRRWHWLNRRVTTRDFIDRALGARRTRGFVRALAIGDRSEIPATEWEILRRTATNHLIAISGLHIGLVAGIGFFLGASLGRFTGNGLLRCPANKVGCLLGTAFALGYAGLAGFAVPTQRALVMVGVVMAGQLLGRSVTAGGLISAALLAVLAWDPLAVMDNGFWLSFGAVVALVLGSGSHSGARIGHSWITAQFVVAAGLLPLLLLFYQQTSVIGPIANLIAIPVVSFCVVPVILFGVVAFELGATPVAGAAVQLAATVFDWLWVVLTGLSQVSFAVWSLSQPSLLAVGVGCVSVAWLVGARGVPGRWLGMVGVLPLVFAAPAKLDHEAYQVTVLDVGQGLSVVIHTRNSVTVYDTGAKYRSGLDMGTAVLLPYLRARGVRRIDTLLISHGDNDHVGGSGSLLLGIRVGMRLSSVPHLVPGARRCRAGQIWFRDGVEFRILSPWDGSGGSPNDASCVLRVASRYGSVLLTGDVETHAEALLIQRYGKALHSKVLLVPHQGSKTSSTPPFLDAVAPQLGIIAAGYRNRYGHPHTEVTERYHKRLVPLYNTAESGAVTAMIAQAGITVSEYRDSARRFWFTD